MAKNYIPVLNDQRRIKKTRCKHGHDTSYPDSRTSSYKCVKCLELYREKDRMSKRWRRRAIPGTKERAIKTSQNCLREMEIASIIRRLLEISDVIDFASAALHKELREEELVLVERKNELERRVTGKADHVGRD